MLRFTIAWLVCMVVSGCTGATQEINEPSKLAADAKELSGELESCLNDKEWDALRELHWSESKVTSDALREIYEPKLKRLHGQIAVSERIHYQTMNSSNFEQFADEEDLPGPAELLRGRIEFSLLGNENTNDNDGIHLYAYLCEENGETKIFGYIELD